uniref:Uncharacterized protein n=1 Tax=Aegilops tauschii subsp. strangulata TaxID=200361 RepID=A0A453KBI9_AEGTS
IKVEMTTKHVLRYTPSVPRYNGKIVDRTADIPPKDTAWTAIKWRGCITRLCKSQVSYPLCPPPAGHFPLRRDADLRPIPILRRCHNAILSPAPDTN